MTSLAVADSFQALAQSIHDERTQLQSLAALRPSPDGRVPKAADLHSIDDRITDLEVRLNEIKNFVHSEQSALLLLASLGKAISDQKSTLEKTQTVVGENPLLPKTAAPSSQSGGFDCDSASISHSAPTSNPGTVQLATVLEFEAVPTQTRERATLEDVNSILVEMREVLTSKLSLIALPKATVGKKAMAQWLAYHHRKHITGNSSIVLTEAELFALSPVLGKASRGKQRALVSTLRHLKRLKQIQEDGSPLFIIMH